MIKEKQVLVKINIRNKSHYVNLGYKLENFNIKDKIETLVNVNDIPKSSHTKITSICKLCKSENIISIQKYYTNIKRNNKGYYSCFNCKSIENKKTCLKKYGVESYSKTDEFKLLDRSDWNYDQMLKNSMKTNLEKYGVEHYFNLEHIKQLNKKWMSSNEFKEKSKKTCLEKYGVESYSKTDGFKNKIKINKDLILKKIKNTFLKKYGVEWISKLPDIIEKSTKTKLNNGYIIPDEKMTEFNKYRKKVRNHTNKYIKSLYENWDGIDYYDGEYIKGNFCYNPRNRLYPTIDHKISIYYGFIKNIPYNEIGSIDNLCITKRCINCSKRHLTDIEFL